VRITALLFVALLSLPGVALAQQAQPHISPLLLPQPQTAGSSVPREITLMGSRDNYWLEGAIGGAVLLGAAGIFLAAGLCDADSGTDSCTSATVLTGLSTATAGAVIGAFVGKAIPKP
jgi:hypothetical protein